MTHPDRVVRTGVIGLGYWGPNLARNLADHARSELSWLCDLDPKTLAKAAARYPGVRTTTDIGEMLADPDLDAVAIITPVSTHHALAIAALGAGKHVFVEKPLALNVPDCERVAVYGSAPAALLGTAHAKAGELIPGRLLAPTEIQQILQSPS